MAMSDQTATNLPVRIAALEHLTGPSRGRVTWLDGIALDVSVGSDHIIHVAETHDHEIHDNLIARLSYVDDHYEVESAEDEYVWVNGERVSFRRLQHHDMIEFGERGPLSRFFLYSEHRAVHHGVGDVVSDTVAYLRSSRRPMPRRLLRATGMVFRRLFRIIVVVALVAFAALSYWQYRTNTQLQEQIASGSLQLEQFARALARSQKDALTPADLEALNQEFGRQVVSHEERLEELERHSRASAQVVARTASSVVFLQGGYGFKETASGRMLRLVLGANGEPKVSPRGQPQLSLDGNGPPAERQFTGTGFAIDADGVLVTNRHVALPWEDDANVKILGTQGLEPVLTRFVVYLPNARKAIDVELLRASAEADLALLKMTKRAEDLKGLSLAGAPPAPGEAVILMGYPTGLRSMLAQAGEAFVKALQKAKTVGFWDVAARLAEEGRIAPLASRGIVSQVSGETIVYDAETTHGGSGGPVLNLAGAVIAVNTAILPKFGGSNLGVPAAKVRTLLKDEGLL